uniref:Terminase large subunit n=1 Tax=Siphoviridae sp. ctBAZ2 TaxID=2827801 RepID=A0A8S5S7A5_9CAUD|nr:MAG TPA: terminase large subunit [Siphoviridae sp. ctBAZ2]
MKVSLKSIIGPAFYDVHKHIKNNDYTHYWLKGGRGSLKSSFIGTEIPLGIMRDAQKGLMSNAVVIRRVKDTLRGSVYEQIKWAIYMMKVENEWEMPDSKLQMTYKPTGQVIIFKGADNPKKLKSTKVFVGYIKYVWFEECDEFESHDKITNINQSLLRGGPEYCVFYSFNPPESQRNWCNKEVLIKRDDTFVSHTTYLQAPKEWLGEQFLIEAEHMKKVKPEKYRHDYLGEVTGTGGEVFTNLDIREITKEEIDVFDRLKFGLDFGYAGDPLAFIKANYDKTRRRLFIFDEVYGTRLSNADAVKLIKEINPLNNQVTADSAEPRTINEFKLLGLRITGAKKGPDSVKNGIKFLQDLESIIIDPVRCPNAYREFNEYEIEKDKDGNLRGDFPDKNNHAIDATRYAMEHEILQSKWTL